jgi:hypothetical protein
MPEILRTGEQTRHPWPEGMFIQGGKSGVVLVRDGENYRTAFVEAFPRGTFLRGEGPTVADAEDKCWEKYQHIANCPAQPEHGPFERRKYRNGSGFCTQCGSWFSAVLPPLPEDPSREPGPLEKLIVALGAREATDPEDGGIESPEVLHSSMDEPEATA